MPKKAITWENCIIYKIWNEEDFYIGSTTDFATRKSNHKSDCNNEKTRRYNLKLYQTIREKGGWDAWQMIPLEEYKECKSPTEAMIREEYWRVKTNANLNTIRAYRSEEIKKEENNAYNNAYQKANKVEIAEKSRANYEKNKVEIAEKQRAYREKNKVEIAEKRKANKDKINEKAREKYQENKKKQC